MENLSLVIYLISICDSIQNVTITGVIIVATGFVMLGIAFIGAVVTGEDETETKLKPLLTRWLAVPLIVCTILAVFIPSSKTVAAMYVMPKIAQSETVQELGQGVVDLAKAWIQEAMPEKKGTSK